MLAPCLLLSRVLRFSGGIDFADDENAMFIIWGRLARPNGRLRSNFVALTHNGGLAMTRRALLLPFRSSAQRVIVRPGGRQAKTRANIFMAREVFFRDVLRILISEFRKGQEQPSLGIKD